MKPVCKLTSMYVIYRMRMIDYENALSQDSH